MGNTGIFDLNDLKQELQQKIVFLNLQYGSGLGGPGCIIFLTEDGDEYFIDEEGADMNVHNLMKLFPDIHKCYRAVDACEKDKYGFKHFGGWSVRNIFAGLFFIREDYFDSFCQLYKVEDKDYPLSVARTYLAIADG